MQQKRISILINESLLNQIDFLAANLETSRSQIFRYIANQFIEYIIDMEDDGLLDNSLPKLIEMVNE